MAEDLEFLKLVATRRELLRNGAAGVGSLALHSMLAPDAFAEQVKQDGLHFAPRAKRIIFLFMNGAPSQQDLFDYKPVVDKFHGKELFKT
ncbi:MAG TPA: sulfatase, partial [Planctomycetaceae bacterium]|nr:sulfatase [Planctomycetaceae bacterium]